MSAIEVVNPNHAEYWENIKRRTSTRNANTLIAERLKSMRHSSVYEQFVLDQLEVVLCAATETGVAKHQEDLTALRSDWAERLGEPSIAKSNYCDLACLSQEAVAQVTQDMGGCL